MKIKERPIFFSLRKVTINIEDILETLTVYLGFPFIENNIILNNLSLDKKIVTTQRIKYTSRGHGYGIYSELIFVDSKALK